MKTLKEYVLGIKDIKYCVSCLELLPWVFSLPSLETDSYVSRQKRKHQSIPLQWNNCNIFNYIDNQNMDESWHQKLWNLYKAKTKAPLTSLLLFSPPVLARLLLGWNADQNQLGKKKVCFLLQFIIQCQGKPRQEQDRSLKQNTQRKAVYCLLSPDLIYIVQAHLCRNSTAHRLGLPNKWKKKPAP